MKVRYRVKLDPTNPNHQDKQININGYLNGGLTIVLFVRWMRSILK